MSCDQVANHRDMNFSNYFKLHWDDQEDKVKDMVQKRFISIGEWG